MSLRSLRETVKNHMELKSQLNRIYRISVDPNIIMQIPCKRFRHIPHKIKSKKDECCISLPRSNQCHYFDPKFQIIVYCGPTELTFRSKLHIPVRYPVTASMLPKLWFDRRPPRARTSPPPPPL